MEKSPKITHWKPSLLTDVTRRRSATGSDGPHGRPNLKDPLQVPDGPITRSRAKKIKEAMQGLVQSTWAEFANLLSKTPTFKMGFKEEEPTLINVIQATDGGSIAWYFSANFLFY
jgi:hypothetical protein